MTLSVQSNHLAGLLAAPGRQAPGELPSVDRILDAVRKHLGMDIAFAARFADGRRQFTHISSDRPAPASPGDSEPQEDTFCYRILKGELPELIHDAADHPRAADLPITAALPVGSHLNVPLMLSDGSVYGSFCCLSHEPDLSLTARDLETMRAFAALAADQIERDLDEDATMRTRIARISDMIDRGRLAMVYQPIHRLRDGTAVGVESLARFPDCDERTPDRWFAEAAGVGLGVELEMLAVRQAILGLPYIPAEAYLAVNVSPETAMTDALAEAIESAAPGRLVVEVTEHCGVSDHIALGEALGRLRRRARIAIDDVGAGYSGLCRILELKPDILKLDMSLTRDIHTDPARAALAQAMVGFAGRIGSKIVAEGVETAAELKALQALGIGYGQGYHFSRPMPAVAARHYLTGAADAEPNAPSNVPAAAAPKRRRA